jgi:hypothetical protein
LELGEVGWEGAVEVVVGDVDELELGEGGDLGGDLAGEVVELEGEVDDALEAAEVGGERAREVHGAQVEPHHGGHVVARNAAPQARRRGAVQLPRLQMALRVRPPGPHRQKRQPLLRQRIPRHHPQRNHHHAHQHMDPSLHHPASSWCKPWINSQPAMERQRAPSNGLGLIAWERQYSTDLVGHWRGGNDAEPELCSPPAKKTQAKGYNARPARRERPHHWNDTLVTIPSGWSLLDKKRTDRYPSMVVELLEL